MEKDTDILEEIQKRAEAKVYHKSKPKVQVKQKVHFMTRLDSAYYAIVAILIMLVCTLIATYQA